MCDFGEKGRVECCQNRIYIRSVSAVFPGTLGRGNIDPVMGKLSFNRERERERDNVVYWKTNGSSLLTALFRIFGIRTSWRQIMGGPCSKIRCISSLPFWYPCGPTFHVTALSTVLVETEPVLPRFISHLVASLLSVFVVLNSSQRFHPVRNGGETVLLFSGVRSCKSKYILR